MAVVPDQILSDKRFGAIRQELAEEMHVGGKTIRRNLQTFTEVGFPLEEITGECVRKIWHIKTGDGQPGESFAFDDALALQQDRQLYEPLADTYS